MSLSPARRPQGRLGRRRLRARELDEELRANLSLAMDDAVESGRHPEEALRAARLDFGNFTRAREEARAVWFPGWDSLSQDLRLAGRGLARVADRAVAPHPGSPAILSSPFRSRRGRYTIADR